MKPVIGVDPHLDSFSLCVADPLGRQVEALTLPNAPGGWAEALGIAHRYRVTTVGIEGASGFGASLARHLDRAEIQVIDIPARVTVAGRNREAAGKTDPADARVVARAVLEGFGSPWSNQSLYEALRVVSHRREALVGDQTRDINRLRALLIDIDPPRAARLGRLRSTTAFKTLSRVRYGGDLHRQVTAQAIRTLATDCRRRLTQIRGLTRQLAKLLPPAAHQLINKIDGLGIISAATLLGELAGTDGFGSDARFARWAGAAPLDASSGREERHRLHRGGNRRINQVLHTIIITQARHGGEAAHYISRRHQEGKTKREATRAAKRHLARRIWKTLKQLELT